jgi:hypothetical protein
MWKVNIYKGITCARKLKMFVNVSIYLYLLLHNLYSSLNIIRAIKSTSTGWVGHVARG